MTETPLDYDKIIWQVFAVGILSSVVILYHVHTSLINNPTIKIFSLTLGFGILVYSFMLILGYGTKKNTMICIIRNKKIENYELEKEMDEKLNKKFYSRVRGIGEFILIFIGFYYFLSFLLIEDWTILIPVTIILLFSLMNVTANLVSRKR